MSATEADGLSEQVLVLAPRGRDAEVIAQVLGRASLSCAAFVDLPGLHQRLADGDAGCILLTEEALAGAALETLLGWCDRQPAWSDLPIIVLATRQAGARPRRAADMLERLGNVLLLERPLNAETLARTVRAALRARARQYQARRLLDDLRQLNETLEQRVAERAAELETARETLAFALDCAGMGSWDLDLTSDRARRSRQHDRIFGHDSEITGWGREAFLAYVIDEDRPQASAAFAQAAASGEFALECRIRRADGAVRWIDARGRMQYDAHGAPARMAGIVMDTTERRNTEDALRQAQKLEAIGRLTGGVAHDFNNLLTVIIGGLDLVIRRPTAVERVVRLAGAAMTAARRGEQLTQQLLAFSRRQMLRPQTLDPNRLLRDFAALVQRAVGETVRLQFDLAGEIGAIRVDAAQFEAAVLNLAVNARDAMPQGGTIILRSRNVPRDNAVRISVIDTGTGIDRAIIARAFEPFFTTKEVGKGSGLGLSQVYGFTRSAGGTVEIESEPGRGTTVHLTFPRSPEPAGAEAAEPPMTTLRHAINGETVLLVEDDPLVLDMAVESLEELRYHVMIARTAREALEHLAGPSRIDVLFSDVVMPGGMNGGELATAAKRLRPELKVLLTSGYVGEVSEADPE